MARPRALHHHLDDQRRRGLGYYRWRRQRDLVCDLNRRKTRLRARRNRQASRPSLFAPAMQLIGMHLVPTRDLRNTRARRKTLFNKPQLLRGRPSPPTLPANQNRTRRHACSLICQLLSKLPTHDSAPPGRDWSDAYVERARLTAAMSHSTYNLMGSTTIGMFSR